MIQTINYVCYALCALSVVAGAVIGISCIWLDDVMSMDVAWKGFWTCCILFVASLIGSIVTNLLL